LLTAISQHPKIAAMAVEIRPRFSTKSTDSVAGTYGCRFLASLFPNRLFVFRQVMTIFVLPI
jgi:hypothetical protein